MIAKKARTLLPLLIFLLVPIALAQADGISVSQSLDRSSLAYTDSAIFEITVQWDGPQSAYLFKGSLNPDIERLKPRGFNSSIKSQVVGGREITTRKYTYTLVPVTSGLAQIHPVTISYITWPDSLPGELVTEAMTLSIEPPRAAEVDDGGISWQWVVLAVVIIAAVNAAVIIVRRRLRRAPEPELSHEQRFLVELDRLKLDAGADLKKFQTGLYRILNDWLAAKYNVDLSTKNDEEFTPALVACGLSESRAEKLAGWLIKAQKDKYGPIAAGPGDTIRLEAEVRHFFENI